MFDLIESTVRFIFWGLIWLAGLYLVFQFIGAAVSI
jgi:hypothetical protein